MVPDPRLYDISPPITPRLKVWPGDTPMSREVLRDLKAGHNFTLSTLRTTVHLGAHADAPSHYVKSGPSIDRRSLDYYLGPCQVLAVRGCRNRRIVPRDIPRKITAKRVLLRTRTFDPAAFNKDFASLSTELVDFLHEQGVITIGIDTPSVDPFHSKPLEAHRALNRRDMANLEGLVLHGVPEGTYELIALPLKLVGFDASPVRAVLRKEGPPAP